MGMQPTSNSVTQFNKRYELPNNKTHYGYLYIQLAHCGNIEASLFSTTKFAYPIVTILYGQFFAGMRQESQYLRRECF